ncbi:MAG: lycopene cyclase domain-containing protein [Bacteroidales bacterium]|nr:lycopene cyclase domain-containing protein [Bacteroidales bacterium]MCF8328644.1 lycopene cyclase domain-containing protein [Bacteroidales bacterium]
MEKWTYALLLLGSLSVPIIRSFEKRIYFKGKWPALFAGIFVMMLVFIPWDVAFTRQSVWQFNHDYVGGWFIAGLPVEEWLFFIIIPYAVMFIYEVLKYFLPRFYFPRFVRGLAFLLGIGMFVIALAFTGKIYTTIVAALTGILLLWQVFGRSWSSWLSHFFLAYIVSVIPFLIVNGVLTALPVVSYNNTENLALRITTIPVEDFAYLMSMMLIVTMVYEQLRRRRGAVSGE